MQGKEIDAVRLGLIWRRMDGIVDQVAETFVRAAFSVVVRERRARETRTSPPGACNQSFCFSVLFS